MTGPSMRTAAVLALVCALAVSADALKPSRWRRAHATFYGNGDASGTMNGACGYGNLYAQGYGAMTTALSTPLFAGGAACGQCYRILCDAKAADSTPWCKRPRAAVTVTATNFCPPSSNGGWCDPPRPHFDMSQPAWEKIGVCQGGVIPIVYQRVPCVRKGGVRFTINGQTYFQLVLLTNVAAAGSIQAMDIKGSGSDWMPMAHNWGANWHSLAYLDGQGLSFRVTITDGQTLVFSDVVPPNWSFGQTFESNLQFK